MKILNEYFIRLSKDELLLFLGYMAEKDDIITLTNRVVKGELKMYKLNPTTQYKVI